MNKIVAYFYNTEHVVRIAWLLLCAASLIALLFLPDEVPLHLGYVNYWYCPKYLMVILVPLVEWLIIHSWPKNRTLAVVKGLTLTAASLVYIGVLLILTISL